MSTSGPKRTQKQREEHLSYIGDRILQGDQQSEIAQALSITQQQVSQDLVIVRERWVTQYLKSDEDTLIGEELARLSFLAQEYLKGWRGSALERCPGGDPRFLAGINKCIEQRCRLLGLYKPERIVAGLDAKELAASFNEAMEQKRNITDARIIEEKTNE